MSILIFELPLFVYNLTLLVYISLGISCPRTRLTYTFCPRDRPLRLSLSQKQVSVFVYHLKIKWRQLNNTATLENLQISLNSPHF